MICRPMIAASALLLVVCAVRAQNKPADIQNSPSQRYRNSGVEMYKQYCSACHGAAGKGDGPAANALRIPPANLTTLAKRHGGKFPTDYVASVLQFGPGMTAHGSPDMPTWGPLFQILDNQDKPAVQQRIKNLCDYLATLQAK
jgi:mono/diheme cytochrome c family protein